MADRIGVGGRCLVGGVTCGHVCCRVCARLHIGICVHFVSYLRFTFSFLCGSGWTAQAEHNPMTYLGEWRSLVEGMKIKLDGVRIAQATSHSRMYTALGPVASELMRNYYTALYRNFLATKVDQVCDTAYGWLQMVVACSCHTVTQCRSGFCLAKGSSHSPARHFVVLPWV